MPFQHSTPRRPPTRTTPMEVVLPAITPATQATPILTPLNTATIQTLRVRYMSHFGSISSSAPDAGSDASSGNLTASRSAIRSNTLARAARLDLPNAPWSASLGDLEDSHATVRNPTPQNATTPRDATTRLGTPLEPTPLERTQLELWGTPSPCVDVPARNREAIRRTRQRNSSAETLAALELDTRTTPSTNVSTHLVFPRTRRIKPSHCEHSMAVSTTGIQKVIDRCEMATTVGIEG